MRITVTGGKGGTGKSTVAVGLAVELAAKKSTMLVDVDVDCPDDHIFLSIEREKIRDVYQPIPKFDFSKCTKCGKCAEVCKQNAIVFVRDKYPAFIPDMCIGCKACIFLCPTGAIKESKKKIGEVFEGKGYGIDFVSGQLEIGQLASGEMVIEVKKAAEELERKLQTEMVIIDSAAGIGCPVIASISGSDYVVAVTEPTPSAMNDLWRVLGVVEHFRIPYGIVINKADLDKGFAKRIEDFAEKKNIPVLGRIPYDKKFIKALIKMKPIVAYDEKFKRYFQGILNEIGVAG